VDPGRITEEQKSIKEEKIFLRLQKYDGKLYD
jgi:hypothetical protein